MKSFTVTNDGGVGTSLRGYTETTRRQIESVFGKPTEYGEGDKVTTQWVIEFDNGVTATIYDWKRYEMGAPKMDEITVWNIGGRELQAVAEVTEALGVGEVFSPWLRLGNLTNKS